MKAQTDFQTFLDLDIRTATIRAAEPLQNARRPAYVLQLDLGDLGMRKSSAQITERYSADELIGKQVVVIANFPVKQIGKHRSECLVLGVETSEGVVLLSTERTTANGLSIS